MLSVDRFPAILVIFTAVWFVLPDLPAFTHQGAVPSDSGVVNVRDYGAKGDGLTDDSDAIQEAFAKNSGSGSVIFLPNGTYLVSKPITWRGAKNRNVLQGESEQGAVVKLMDQAPLFQDPAKPRPIFHTGGAPAQRFQNGFRSLTVDVGQGNPGAVGINFCANNTGAIRSVTIRAGADGKAAGVSGLDLTESEVGPLLVKDLTVIGFDVGIRVRQDLNSVTLENITLRGQRVAGIDNESNMVFARRVNSDNTVPAVINDGRNAIFTLIDSDLRGGTPEQAAIENRHDNAVLFVRNVQTSGYGSALKDSVQGTLPADKIVEWCSDAPVSLFPGELKSLNLPIEETPEVPWEPVAQWVNAAKFGAVPGDGKDDAAAIQAAIDSGAKTIYFPHAREAPRDKRANNPGWEGSYVLENSIIIRGKVNRLIGLDATLNLKKGWPNDKPVFIFEDGDASAVVIQQMAFALGQQMRAPTFVHRANRDLILSSFTGTNHLRHEGKGRLFAEDIVGNEWYVAPGGRVFARQMNLEGAEMKLVNDGGQVWILGLKTEARGPILETKNKGVTEVIGAHLYTCVKSGADRGAFFVQDSILSVVGAGEYAWTRDWATRELLHEVRGNETRTLSMNALKRRHMASMIPFLRSDSRSVPAGSAPPAPRATVAETASSRISLKLEAEPEIAVSVLGMEIRKNNATIAYVKPGLWQEAGLSPETEHTYEVVAYDSFNRKSTPVTVTARTTGDTTPPTTPPDFRTDRVIDLGATLVWKAAKDDIGVTGYEVVRLSDGKPEITEKIAGLTFTDDRVKPGANYQYQVVALDAAGNRSLPALLDVTIPRDPPGEIIIKLAKADQRKKDNFSSKGWFAGDLHPGGWAIYERRELGRLKPFTKATLRYACDKGRGGAELEVILNPTIEKNDKGEPVMTGGTSLGRFTLTETGGWEKWSSITIETSIPNAGSHNIGLRVHKAASTESNALANVDTITFSYE